MSKANPIMALLGEGKSVAEPDKVADINRRAIRKYRKKAYHSVPYDERSAVSRAVYRAARDEGLSVRQATNRAANAVINRGGQILREKSQCP